MLTCTSLLHLQQASYLLALAIHAVGLKPGTCTESQRGSAGTNKSCVCGGSLVPLLSRSQTLGCHRDQQCPESALGLVQNASPASEGCVLFCAARSVRVVCSVSVT